MNARHKPNTGAPEFPPRFCTAWGLESAVNDSASFILPEPFFARSSDVRSPRERCSRSVLYLIRRCGAVLS